MRQARRVFSIMAGIGFANIVIGIFDENLRQLAVAGIVMMIPGTILALKDDLIP